MRACFDPAKLPPTLAATRPKDAELLDSQLSNDYPSPFRHYRTTSFDPRSLASFRDWVDHVVALHPGRQAVYNLFKSTVPQTAGTPIYYNGLCAMKTPLLGEYDLVPYVPTKKDADAHPGMVEVVVTERGLAKLQAEGERLKRIVFTYGDVALTQIPVQAVVSMKAFTDRAHVVIWHP